jgi:HlyD family type I secretion membrane fusion protein
MELTSIIPAAGSKDDPKLVQRHLKSGRSIARRGYWMVGVLVVPALAWMVFAPLASTVVATGVVKVDLNRAMIQHVEGGTVSVVHVRDGQRVKKGDPLLELGDVSVNADKTRLAQRLLAERAGQARLEAEQARRGVLAFPPDLVAAGQKDPVVREQMGKEQALFKARLNTMESTIALFGKQKETIRREIEALRASVRSTEESIAVQTRELDLNKRMSKDGLVSDTQVMQLESRLADYRGRIAQNNADLTRTDQRVGEIDMRINQMDNDYRQQASDQLKVALIRIQEIEQELRKATDASRRQIITAPVDGEVIGMRVNTPGAVIVPREPVAEIVPSNPRLIIEAQIQPQDINRVRKGQEARLRFTAFTYRTTDMGKGSVSYVGGDRQVQRENGMPYYVIHVDVDPESVKQAVRDQPDAKLQAGMPVEVYVNGEDRTVMQYLLEPLTQLMRRAGRER